MRRTRQLLVVAALGCGPTRAPASETAEPGPEPGPAARAPVSRESFRSPSLRTVYAGRGWAALAVPGHLLVIEDDGHLVARDPTSGAVQWRTAVATRGPYAMFGVADVVVLQAGVVVTHVAVDTGAVLSTHSDSCRLRVRAGRGEVEPSRWVAGAAACAFQCRCGVRPFDCESGARGATLDTPVDRIACGEISVVFCDPRPEVLARSRTRVLALLDEEDQAALAGLDARSFTQVWSRRDLAPMARASGVGVDPDGRSCWVADAEAVEVFSCATGLSRWGARLAEPGRVDAAVAVDWREGDILVVRTGPRRDHVELRGAAAGELRWSITLPPGERALLPGLAAAGDGPRRIVDAATGRPGPILAVGAGETLVPDVDGHLRIGGDHRREYDPSGELRRAAGWPGGALVRATPTHLVAQAGERLHVLPREPGAPALTLPGRWAALDAAAFAGDAVLLVEETEDQAGRVVLLRP